jgi:hypothetical protein
VVFPLNENLPSFTVILSITCGGALLKDIISRYTGVLGADLISPRTLKDLPESPEQAKNVTTIVRIINDRIISKNEK